MTRLKLWGRLTELDEAKAGPAIASRLQGEAFQVALNLRITDQERVQHVAEDALAFPGQNARVSDDGQHMLPEVPSGHRKLLDLLQNA